MKKKKDRLESIEWKLDLLIHALIEHDIVLIKRSWINEELEDVHIIRGKPSKDMVIETFDYTKSKK